MRNGRATRNGYDWTKRYPRIVESALMNRQKQFVIDGPTDKVQSSLLQMIAHPVDAV
jgi:ATP-dependent DNA ligase